jgi:hypothetical protein
MGRYFSTLMRVGNTETIHKSAPVKLARHFKPKQLRLPLGERPPMNSDRKKSSQGEVALSTIFPNLHLAFQDFRSLADQHKVWNIIEISTIVGDERYRMAHGCRSYP